MERGTKEDIREVIVTMERGSKEDYFFYLYIGSNDICIYYY